jgi:DNA mismatch repair protein MutL
MTDIRELDPQTVERIAAGEVVERPASVVKELVENSLDADAGRIEVAVESGGTEGIRVTDDGVGMTRQQVRRAVEKHTTSKISDIADLEGGVGTLGFRGEALHAIGAVSRLTITTRPQGGRVGADGHGGGAPDHASGGADHGTELLVEGGEVAGVDAAGCPPGTTIEVTDLFYNVPARRKYLKQESTEFAHVNTVVTSYALANPDVAISLSHDGRETFATTGSGDRRETIMAVYGREVAQSMVTVDAEAVPDGPLDGLTGLLSHPETNRASREYLSTFVNGRYVTASTVRDAIVEGYGAQLASDRYPFAVVDLGVDPADVDVNVHPRKLEVRFADDEGISRQVRTAIEKTLLAEGLIRSKAPRGRSAPEQTEIRPEGGADSDGSEAAAGDSARAASGTDTDGETTTAGSEAPAQPPEQDPTTETRPDDGAATSDRSETSPTAGSTVTSSQPDEERSPAVDATDRPDPTGPGDEDGPRSRKFTPTHEQARLGGESVEGESFDRLPSMTVLGQLRDTYVVAETSDGVVLVDQHAADERVNYERLCEQFDGETATQVLAEPIRLELTAREAAVFDAHTDALARLGFRAERVEERTVAVRTVPSLVAEPASPEMLRDVLAEFVASDAEQAETVEAAADEFLADLACYPSVTGNTSLTEGSVVELLGALDECENPYACPHGRPTIVELDWDELEARFERDYPGHGG